MKIGIDLDNTIVCYDRVFFALGRDASLPAEVVQAGKLGIREFLRQQNREDEWTVMQGVAYGPGMEQAEPFEGVLAFIERASAGGHELSVVSHRTRYPYLGEQHDLHSSAREWLGKHGIDRAAEVFLEETADEKSRRIGALGCEAFIDDLPEFLGRRDFPAGIRRIHFDPSAASEVGGFERARSWGEVAGLLRR